MKKQKVREYRVRLVKRNANPFEPNDRVYAAQFTTYIVKASSKRQIRESFKLAQKKNRRFKNKKIVSIEEIKKEGQNDL